MRVWGRRAAGLTSFTSCDSSRSVASIHVYLSVPHPQAGREVMASYKVRVRVRGDRLTKVTETVSQDDASDVR